MESQTDSTQRTRIGSFEQALEQGQTLMGQGCYADALPFLEMAHQRETENAVARSAYGLCLGLAERDFDRAVELCGSAVKQEFFNPDLYLAVAHLHLAFGFKADGIRYLRRGRMIDPGHTGIAGALRGLGARQAPPLRFLPRTHPLNRMLGRARSRLSWLSMAHAA